MNLFFFFFPDERLETQASAAQQSPRLFRSSQVKFDTTRSDPDLLDDAIPSHGRSSGQSSSESSPQIRRRCYSANLTPTRTRKKLYFEEKKSPFLPFGCNDTDRDVGDKKTFNISAPQTEVPEFISYFCLERRSYPIVI